MLSSIIFRAQRRTKHHERVNYRALWRRRFARRRGAGCRLRACRKQIVGGTRGFLYARFLLRIGHLPNLPPGINAVYMKWAGYSPALLILLTRRHATAGRRIGAQAVHERRGATDRGEYRQAAGASAEGVTAVSFYPSGVGSEGAHHHAATNSTCAVYCGLCRTCNHRLHSHAEAEKAPLTVASVWINNAARRSRRRGPPRSGRGLGPSYIRALRWRLR